MTIEQIRKLDQIKTKKQISVGFMFIFCVGFLLQLSRMDDIICMIFLFIMTIIFGSFAVSMMNAHYDKKIDRFYRKEINEFL